MNNYKTHIKASWLHVSDLHVFPEADTTLMLDDYKELAKIISPQFLIVTGDFCDQKYKTDFSLARKYLESLISIFNIDKKDVFLIPGNHDVTQYDGRADAISDICKHTDENYNVYSKYSLHRGFSDYNSFVYDFYSGVDINDSRITDPSGVHCVVWNNLINILYVNTALISDGKEHGEILDINLLSECKIDFNRPTIMVGHHKIDSLYTSHLERVKRIIDRRKISAYLHGDSHRYANNPISAISTPNSTIPGISCAKSAPQSGDSYSDIGVVYYEWRNDNHTYVQAYKWAPKGFIEDPAYYYDINKRYFFSMIYDNSDPANEAQTVYEKIKKIMVDHSLFMSGEWVTEAERIWLMHYHEGIGRCLLLYYYERTDQGIAGAYQRVQELYHGLEQISNREPNTNEMLEAIKTRLYFD